MGGMIQVNAAAGAMKGVFDIPRIAVGCAFAFLALVAMKRGAAGILGFTEKLVPLMTLGFVALSVSVICVRPEATVSAIRLVFQDAFSIKCGVGGVIGFVTSDAIRYGTMRGIISNEAGCGTAPSAHAVADCSSPARQGVWGIFEVFVDTILLCTLTAIVIIVGGAYTSKTGDYMMLTVFSYSSVLGDAAGGFIAVSVVLFGLATVLCWGHYGMESVRYLLGRKGIGKAFIYLYVLSVAVGSVLSADAIWELADFAVGAMTVINLCIIIAMSREVKEETDRWLDE